MLTQDDVTQFCIEEAVFLRFQTIGRTPDLEGPDLEDDGSVPGITPGERQAAEHHARMAELRGQ